MHVTISDFDANVKDTRHTATATTTPGPTSTAAINPRELDEALAGLRSVYGDHLTVTAAPGQLTGGFWAEMWALELAYPGRELPDRVVLRLAPNAEHSAKETAIQRGVAAAGFPTPRIFASGPGTPAGSQGNATSGTRSWNVMEFAPGEPLLAGLSGFGALVKLPRLARVLPVQLAQVMAQLHALDISTLDIGPAPAAPAPAPSDPQPDSTGTVQDTHCDAVAGILKHFSQRSQAIGDDSLMHAVHWLEAKRPSNTKLVMCHGDLHPFNVLHHDGQLIVLDWTAAQVADPAFDVTYTALLLASPPLQAPRAVMPIINAAARALSRRFIRCYQRHSGTQPIAPQRFDWFTTLHHVRMLLEIAEWRHAGVLKDHQGHPYLTMQSEVEANVSARTGAAFD